jgi:hypothetical protein
LAALSSVIVRLRSELNVAQIEPVGASCHDAVTFLGLMYRSANLGHFTQDKMNLPQRLAVDAAVAIGIAILVGLSMLVTIPDLFTHALHWFAIF